jgi:ABC-type phosphate/phosphonate transport system substrate-binding protein
MRGGLAHVVALALGLLASSVTAGPPAAETMQVAVHLGALRDSSRADVEVSLKVWAEELTHVLAVPAKVHFYQTLPDIRRDLDNGKVNFVITDGINLLRHFDIDELTDGFGGRAPGEDTLILMVRKGAGIKTGKDLAGKRVVLLSDNEISDLWMETYCLRQFQAICQQAGVIIVKENRSRQQVLNVFFGKADAALVRGYPYELALELNPQIRERTTVLERIHIYSTALGLFSNRVSPAFREFVISKVPKMLDHPRGRQILEVMQTDKVERYPKSVLEPIRQLMREHETLLRRHGKGANK